MVPSGMVTSLTNCAQSQGGGTGVGGGGMGVEVGGMRVAVGGMKMVVGVGVCVGVKTALVEVGDASAFELARGVPWAIWVS
jgi:hypothetical protein